jgi:hypothetical protein
LSKLFGHSKMDNVLDARLNLVSGNGKSPSDKQNFGRFWVENELIWTAKRAIQAVMSINQSINQSKFN